MDREIARRRFLSLTAATTALPLAGCPQGNDPGTDDGAVSTVNTPTAPTAETPENGTTATGTAPTATDGSSTATPSPSPRRLTWGQTVSTPQDLQVTVNGGQFTETYSGGGTNETITPPADRKFVVILVQIRNPTPETTTFPSLGYFRLRANGSLFDVLLEDPSVQLSVDPDSIKRIQLPYLVPAATEPSDIEVLWSPVYQNGRIAVLWGPG